MSSLSLKNYKSKSGEVKINRRKRIKNTNSNVGKSTTKTRDIVEQLAGSFQDNWKFLTLAHKEELIVQWSVNSGIISGKRFTKQELTDKLGMTSKAMENCLEKLRKTSIDIFSTQSTARQHVFDIFNRVLQQTQSDRSRAVLHADILELQLEDIKKKMEEAQLYPETTAREREKKRRDLTYWSAQYRSTSYQKIESIRVLLEATNACSKLLSLFSGKSGDKKNPGSLEGFIPTEEADSNSENTDLIDHKEAVRILSEQGDQILPSQQNNMFNRGSRNPSVGFEELADQEQVIE